MPYEITWEERGVYRRYFGHTDGAELARSVQEVELDIRFDQIRYVLNDMLASEGINVTEEAVTEISAIDGGAELSNPNIRIAIVADKPALLAVGEAYIAAALNTYPTRLFFTLEEARAWLAEPVELTPHPHGTARQPACQ